MVDVVIPVYKPEKKFYQLIGSLATQSIRPESITLMYTITGLDERETSKFQKAIQQLFMEYNAEDISLSVVPVAQKDFSHGTTRNEGAAKGHAPYILMMTQDAVPTDNKLVENMVRSLENNPGVSQVYGRQLTDSDAPAYIKYTQSFNYPSESMKKSIKDIDRLGIKTIFCSDVCCMYRRDVFSYIGGFENIFFNEDMIFARKALNAGYEIYYNSEAAVIHYHRYGIRAQFRRNYEIAASQKMYPEIFGDLSSVGEGKKMVKYVLGRLIKKRSIFQALNYIILTGAKYAGFLAGKHYKIFPGHLKQNRGSV